MIKPKTWESGLTVLKSMLIIIPQKLLSVCDYIAQKMGNDDEFSILTTIERVEEDIVYLSDTHYIPKQEVTHTSIDYLDDMEAHKYNVVIHRHPDGINNFSGTDREYINQNFTASLLYTRVGKFVHGVYNVRVNNFLIPIPVEIEVVSGIDELDISAIAKKSCAVSYPARNYQESIYSRSWEYGSFGEGLIAQDNNDTGKWEVKNKNDEQKELKFEEIKDKNDKDENKDEDPNSFITTSLLEDRIYELEDEVQLLQGELERYKAAVAETTTPDELQRIEELADDHISYYNINSNTKPNGKETK